MIRINYRFLAVVLVCCVVAAGGIHALHHFQTRRTAHIYLEGARTARQDRNLPEALSGFRRYLQLIPSDIDALAEYGVSLAERCSQLKGLRRERTLSAQQEEEWRRTLGQAYGVLERVLRSQPDREDQVSLRRSLATVAVYMQRYKDALEQLQNPVMADAKDWEILEMKAVCQARTGEILQAIKSYDEAIRLAPDELDVHPERAGLYSGQVTLLRNLAPDQLRGYSETAKSLGGLDRPKTKDTSKEDFDPRQDADYYIESMLRKNPTSAVAHRISARYWYGLDNIDQAISDADKALSFVAARADASASEKAESLVLAADLRRVKATRSAPRDHKELLGQARELAKRAVTALPQYYSSYVVAAHIERQDGAPEKAIEWFRAGLKECPEEPRLLSPLAVDLLDLGQEKTGEAREAVLKEATTRIAQLQAIPEERWPRPELAEAILGYLRGRLDYLQGKWADAAIALERASAGLIDYDPLLRSAQFWLGSSYGQLAAASKQPNEKEQLTEKQLAAYGRARGSDGTGIQARLATAQTLASIGRLGEAIDEQRSAMAIGEQRSAMMPPGALAAGWFQLAQWLIERYQSLPPSERNWPEVEKALLEAAKGPGVDPSELSLRKAQASAMRADAARVEGNNARAQEDTTEAEKVLRGALDRKPDRPGKDADIQRLKLWIALAGVVQQEQAALQPEMRDWSRVAIVFNDAEKDLGNSMPLWLARARYLSRRDVNQAAPELIKLADKMGGFSPSEQAGLLAMLAEAMLQWGKVEEAKRLCERAAQALQRLGAAANERNTVQIRLQLCLLQFDAAAREFASAIEKKKADDVKRAQDAMKKCADEMKTQKLDVRGDRWLVAEAIRTRIEAQQRAEKKDPEASRLFDTALRYLAEARNLNPEWSRVPLLMAEIYDQLGQSSEALQNYREAIDKGERSVAAMQRALRALYAQPGVDPAAEAARLIQPWIAQPNLAASDISAVMQLAPDVALRPEALPQSLATARQAVKTSQNSDDFVWLGQILMAAADQDYAAKQVDAAKGKLAEAETYLRRASEMAPKEPAAWIVLLVLLVRTDRAEEAKGMISKVRDNVPQDQLPRVLPRCYEVVGDREEAVRLYEAGLAKPPDDLPLRQQAANFYLKYNQLPEARGHLEKLAARGLPAGAGEGERRIMFWARRQLAVILRSSKNEKDRERALALINQNLADEPRSADDLRAKAFVVASREEAIPILETLFGQNAATPEDTLRLFQLYAVEQDRTEPAAGGKNAPKPPQRNAARDWGRAKQLMQALLAARPGEPRYLAEYVAALLKRREITEAERAEAQMKIDSLKLMPGRPGEGAERARLLLATAASCQDFARRSTTPESKPFVATFQQDAVSCMNQALDWAEKAGPTLEPITLAKFASQLLGTHAANSAQLQRLNAVLDAAINEQKRPVPLLLVLADLRTGEERFDEVEALYEEILRGLGGNVAAPYKNYKAVVLNNLAVLLALRGKRLDEAAKFMKEAIDLMGSDPTLLDSRAMVAIARGRPKEALKDLDRAIEADPRAAPYFHRALVRQQNGQRAAAREDWDKATQLGLKEESLHPLERRMYAKLRDSLKQG